MYYVFLPLQSFHRPKVISDQPFVQFPNDGLSQTPAKTKQHHLRKALNYQGFGTLEESGARHQIENQHRGG
jgi:hypothetical protein